MLFVIDAETAGQGLQERGPGQEDQGPVRARPPRHQQLQLKIHGGRQFYIKNVHTIGLAHDGEVEGGAQRRGENSDQNV